MVISCTKLNQLNGCGGKGLDESLFEEHDDYADEGVIIAQQDFHRFTCFVVNQINKYMS